MKSPDQRKRAISGPHQAREAIEWNRRNPVGCLVLYTPIIGERAGEGVRVTRVRHEAALAASGHALCFLEGVRGGVSIDAADSAWLLPILHGDRAATVAAMHQRGMTESEAQAFADCIDGRRVDADLLVRIWEWGRVYGQQLEVGK